MKKALAILLSLTLILTLAACGQEKELNNSGTANDSPAGNAGTDTTDVPETPDKVYEIKLVTTNPSTDPSVVLMEEMCDKILERTNGGVDIQVYANGEILVGDEGIEAVMSDAAVIVFGDVSGYYDYAPVANTLCAAYLYDDYETAMAFQETDAYKQAAQQIADAGVHVISNAWVVGNRGVMTAGVPVKTVSDCAKINIRVPSNTMFVDAWTAFGANYTAEGWSAGFSDCQSGLLQGAEGTPGKMTSSGLGAVLSDPVYSCINYMVVVVGMCCGEGFWQTLPTEYQDIITEEMANYAQINNVTIAALEEEQLAQLESEGVTVIRSDEIDLDSFRAAVAPVNESYPMWDELSGAVNEIIAAKTK